MSRLTKGYTIAGVGIAIWSTTGVLISYLITRYQLPALTLALWRNLLVCVALFPALLVFRRSLLRISAADISFYLVYGLILAVFNSIWALSVQANGAAVATVLAYSSAGFTAILARWLFGERLGLPKAIAIVLSLSGCVMVSKAYSSQVWALNLQGVLTGLLSGLLFALYTLFGKEAARRTISAWTALAYSFGFGTLFVLVFNFIPWLPSAAGSFSMLLPNLPLDGWLILATLSAGPTLLGFGLYNISLSYLPASIANLLATLEPALTAAEAYLFLGERMTGIQIVGGLIIISAVLIVQIDRGPTELFLRRPDKLSGPA